MDASFKSPSPEPTPGSRDSRAYTDSVEQLATDLGATSPLGLTETEADDRRRRFGDNALKEAPPTPWWKKLIQQFNELVVWILIAAAVISGVLGDAGDAIAILAIVLLNGVIGFLQEQRAEQALAALARMSAPSAKVYRNGHLTTLPAVQLVPGDRIELEAGDNIPADARLLSSFSLRVQEASLTGESAPVAKEASAGLPVNTPLGDRRNIVYMSTVVAAGKASALVVATGMNTELGHIAGLLQKHETEPTPLQRRLGELGKYLILGCLAIVAVVFVLEIRRTGAFLDVLVRAISLAVAAVPEGLPAVVTLTLALGLRRMVQRNVLIRRLPSVETLGSVTVICSDKTGTLTRNEMTVRNLFADRQWFRVTGSGYAPHGEFQLLSKESELNSPGEKAAIDEGSALKWALQIAFQCNNSQIEPTAEGGAAWRVIGDPTEGALRVAAIKGGLSTSEPLGRTVFEIPFDSDRKAMSVIVEQTDGTRWMLTKGAPEMILGACCREARNSGEAPLDDTGRRAILDAAHRMANQALRVLALAYRELPAGELQEHQETQLVFAGLAGMIDPPREEVAAAIVRCGTAGIRPVMITGDHPQTATAVARELKLARPGDETIDGATLDQLSDADLEARVARISVYARVTPEHKLRVVRAWRKNGHVVAMTGDGVNDAPAVKAADIGIAMGITGTDVTKEASAMVLTDDNFTSIVSAVEEGRGIFDNIQKFVHFLLSCNTGEVLLMFVAALLGWPSPLQPIQLLWINLVTDGLPALALAMERPERDIMTRPPRSPREPVINWQRGLRILWHGGLVAVVCLIGFAWARSTSPDVTDRRPQTIVFCIAALSQLAYAFACRSHTRSAPEVGFASNPHLLAAIAFSATLQIAAVSLPQLDRVFDTVPIHTADWVVVIALSLLPVTIIELIKVIRSLFK